MTVANSLAVVLASKALAAARPFADKRSLFSVRPKMS